MKDYVKGLDEVQQQWLPAIAKIRKGKAHPKRTHIPFFASQSLEHLKFLRKHLKLDQWIEKMRDIYRQKIENAERKIKDLETNHIHYLSQLSDSEKIRLKLHAVNSGLSDPLRILKGYEADYADLDPLGMLEGYETNYADPEPLEMLESFETDYADSDPLEILGGYEIDYADTTHSLDSDILLYYFNRLVNLPEFSSLNKNQK